MSLFTAGLDQRSGSALRFRHVDVDHFSLIFLLFGGVYGSNAPQFAPACSFLSLRPQMTTPKSSFLLQYSNSEPLARLPELLKSCNMFSQLEHIGDRNGSFVSLGSVSGSNCSSLVSQLLSPDGVTSPSCVSSALTRVPCPWPSSSRQCLMFSGPSD